ncbi:MAG TPA: hypothetical protein VJY37_05310, partial [Anaerovoracaceae bacterium]|nr:hypothetical protein [Anaerovoracaceae bacterium]
GKVTATSQNTGIMDTAGIRGKNIIISGGEVEASADGPDDAMTYGIGLSTSSGNITISGGAVNATGGMGAMYINGLTDGLTKTPNLESYINPRIEGKTSRSTLQIVALETFKANFGDGKFYTQIKVGPTPPSRPSRPSAPTINTGTETEAGVGGTTAFDKISGTLTITPAEGFAVKDVLVNGASKGSVTSLEGVSVYDNIKVVFAKKTTEQIQAEKYAKIKAGVEATTMKIKSGKALNNKNRITWSKSKGYKLSYVELWRKAGSGKYKLFATLKAGSASYTNTKNVKDGVTYRYKLRGVRKLGDEKVGTEFSNAKKLTGK